MSVVKGKLRVIVEKFTGFFLFLDKGFGAILAVKMGDCLTGGEN